MSSRRTLPRIITAFMLLVPLLIAGVSQSLAGAQSSGSSVEIHKRTCPTGYSDNRFFRDCHDNATPDVTFELANLRDTTDASGDVLFFNLNAGTYTITESVPGGSADMAVFCSMADNVDQSASYEYVAGGIRLTAPENTGIVCDWYNIPYNLRGDGGDGGGNGNGSDDGSGAAVTIHARTCPAGYTGNEPFETCHDMPLPGATFTLANLSATTPASGNTIFYQLNPGSYTIERAGEGSFWFDSVFCSLEADASQTVPTTDTNDGFTIDLDANQRVICDWYFVPLEGSGNGGNGGGDAGQLTLHMVECPAGYDDTAYFQDCHDNRREGVTFNAYGPEGFIDEGVETDSEGVITFDGIDVGGSVTILEQFGADNSNVAQFIVYCSNAAGNPVQFDYQERDNAGGIRLNVSGGDEILCDWYNIPAQ